MAPRRLMTGFDKKVVHFTQDSDTEVTFAVAVDFLGDGTWRPCGSFTVEPGGYVHHEFPDAYSAHWVRVRADKACQRSLRLIELKTGSLGRHS